MIPHGSTVVLVYLFLVSAAFGSGPSQSGSAPSAGKEESGSSSHDTVLRLAVRRVPIDVVVTDKQGNPMRGLRKDDFLVKEDGKKQRIITFEYEDGTAPFYVPPKLPPLPASTFTNVPNEPERGPLYVLFFDMVNTSRDNQMAFRKELLDFVDSAEPGVRFALFAHTSELRLIQGFTSDRARLHAAILSQGPGPHLPKVFLGGATEWGPGEFGAGDTGAALAMLNRIAGYLDGFPGRKNLIWLADKFPIPVGPAGQYVTDPLIQVNDDVKRTYAALMRSQVAVYPIDLKGVVGGIGPLSEFQDEDDIAQSTGGHAYHGDNGIRFLMDQAVAHGSSYYAITYSPTNRDYHGSQRRIEVILPKYGEAGLSYRRFYYATPETAGPSQPRQADTLYASIEHGAPMVHDLLFSVHLAAEGAPRMATTQQMSELEDSPAYFRTRQRAAPRKPLASVKLQSYLIQYGVFDSQLKIIAKRRGAPPMLEFSVAAYDADGRLLNSVLNDGLASSEPDSSGKFAVMFHAEQKLDVPLGAAYLRMAIRDLLTDRTGALEVPLPLSAETDSRAVVNAN